MAFAAKNRGMSVCCHMTLFGRELEHFHTAKQTNLDLRGSQPLLRDHSLQQPQFPCQPSLRTLVFVCPESLWTELPPSATAIPFHQDKPAEVFLRGLLPQKEAFPRTVNSKHTKFSPTVRAMQNPVSENTVLVKLASACHTRLHNITRCNDVRQLNDKMLALNQTCKAPIFSSTICYQFAQCLSQLKTQGKLAQTEHSSGWSQTARYKIFFLLWPAHLWFIYLFLNFHSEIGCFV